MKFNKKNVFNLICLVSTIIIICSLAYALPITGDLIFNDGNHAGTGTSTSDDYVKFDPSGSMLLNSNNDMEFTSQTGEFLFNGVVNFFDGIDLNGTSISGGPGSEITLDDSVDITGTLDVAEALYALNNISVDNQIQAFSNVDTLMYMLGGEIRFLCDGTDMLHMVESSSDYISLNPYTLNIDTIINGDTIEDLFFINAGTDSVGIKTPNPSADFVCSGTTLLGSNTNYSVEASGFQYHYKLNDDAANTTVEDALGNSNGILNGGDNTETLSDSGKINTSLNFDGSTDYVDTGFGSSFISGTTDFCVSFWFKADDGQPSDDQAIFGCGNDLNDVLQIRLFSEGYIGAHGKIDGSWILSMGSTSISPVSDGPTDWIHVAVQYSETNDKKYLWMNGELVYEAAFTSDLSNYGNPYNFRLADHYGTDSFAGSLDDFRFYNSLKTDADIQFIYNLGRGTEESSIDPFALTVDGDSYFSGSIYCQDLLVLSDSRDKIVYDDSVTTITENEAENKLNQMAKSVKFFNYKSDLYKTFRDKKITTRTVTYYDPVTSDTLTTTVLDATVEITTKPIQNVEPRLGFIADTLPDEFWNIDPTDPLQRKRIDPIAIIAFQQGQIKRLKNKLQTQQTKGKIINARLDRLEAIIKNTHKEEWEHYNLNK